MNLATDYDKLARELLAYQVEHGATLKQALDATDSEGCALPDEPYQRIVCLQLLDAALKRAREYSLPCNVF